MAVFLLNALGAGRFTACSCSRLFHRLSILASVPQEKIDHNDLSRHLDRIGRPDTKGENR